MDTDQEPETVADLRNIDQPTKFDHQDLVRAFLCDPAVRATERWQDLKAIASYARLAVVRAAHPSDRKQALAAYDGIVADPNTERYIQIAKLRAEIESDAGDA